MIWVGTSGWQYRDWRGAFYPEGLPQRLWLEHFVTQFPTVEVNNAFYRLPSRDVFASWRERTPAGFQVAVKMSRYLTHIKRLRDAKDSVKLFMSHAEALGDRLGPVLLQLPPTLRADAAALTEALKSFPGTVRVAVEPRHESWWNKEIRDLLEHHDAALCWADRLGRPVTPLWRTASFGYLRLHEGRARPRPRYGRTALSSWAERVSAEFKDEPVFVYFNNDPHAAAITDARHFAGLAQRKGLDCASPPAPENSFS